MGLRGRQNILNHDSVQPVQMFSNPAKCNNWLVPHLCVSHRLKFPSGRQTLNPLKQQLGVIKAGHSFSKTSNTGFEAIT